MFRYRGGRRIGFKKEKGMRPDDREYAAAVVNVFRQDSIHLRTAKKLSSRITRTALSVTQSPTGSPVFTPEIADTTWQIKKTGQPMIPGAPCFVIWNRIRSPKVQDWLSIVETSAGSLSDLSDCSEQGGKANTDLPGSGAHSIQPLLLSPYPQAL